MSEDRRAVAFGAQASRLDESFEDQPNGMRIAIGRRGGGDVGRSHQQRTQPDRETGLLLSLTDGTRGGRFTELDATAGELPTAGCRRQRASSNEKNVRIAIDDERVRSDSRRLPSHDPSLPDRSGHRPVRDSLPLSPWAPGPLAGPTGCSQNNNIGLGAPAWSRNSPTMTSHLSMQPARSLRAADRRGGRKPIDPGGRVRQPPRRPRVSPRPMSAQSTCGRA